MVFYHCFYGEVLGALGSQGVEGVAEGGLEGEEEVVLLVLLLFLEGLRGEGGGGGFDSGDWKGGWDRVLEGVRLFFIGKEGWDGVVGDWVWLV